MTLALLIAAAFVVGSIAGFVAGFNAAPRAADPDAWKRTLAARGYSPCSCGTWVAPADYHNCKPLFQPRSKP